MKIIGANYSENQCIFRVWAPEKKTVSLHLVSPASDEVAMQKDDDGYFEATISNLPPNTQYWYSIEKSTEKYPDPASHFQPDGVHAASQVVDHQHYPWKNTEWRGLALSDLILYELHVGTFTKEGTFDAIIPHLDHLVDLGINAIELMPVAQFPGNRNWGYDGVYPFAVQNSYGGPDKLKALVDAAHGRGIAVFLDVVFNHFGPEGNYVDRFGPYFTNTYCTPWGDAVNLDKDYSDGVREYFFQAIAHWYEHYRLDGLRVDAVHMMFDSGAVNFWEMVAERLDVLKEKSGRNFYLIAESDLNSPKIVKSPEFGGWNFNAQWLDDFHHSLYVLLDKEGQERYADFGQLEQLAKAYTDGFVHSGEYVNFRKRNHGSSSRGLSGDTFVVFNQNHDQIGNRVGGERLCMLVDPERQKLAAAAILLAPYLPMLFMGEEFAADTPFFYFVSHSEKELIEMVVEGRKKEFECYQWEADPPNPQEESTFDKSKMNWENLGTGNHLIMFNWHKELIRLRKSHPTLKNFNKNDIRVNLLENKGLVIHRKCAHQKQELLCILNFSDKESSLVVPDYKSEWSKILDSRQATWLPENTLPENILPQYLNGNDTITIPGLSVLVYESPSAI